MAKIIKITEEVIKQCLEEFSDFLRTEKMTNGKLEYTKKFEVTDKEAVVRFEEMAWQKVQALVRKCDKEVGFHGLAKKIGSTKDEASYLVYDIIVYPQQVTGTTVNTDQEEYQDWLYSLEDEEFNNLRMQGHSHVNMGVTPSSVDLELYQKFLAQLDEEMFYIFMIFNKKEDITCLVYDMAENLYFDANDCRVEVVESDDGIEKFLKDSMDKITTKSYYTPSIKSKPWSTESEDSLKGYTKKKNAKRWMGFHYGGEL